MSQQIWRNKKQLKNKKPTNIYGNVEKRLESFLKWQLVKNNRYIVYIYLISSPTHKK